MVVAAPHTSARGTVACVRPPCTWDASYEAELVAVPPACLDKSKNLPNAVIKSRADIEANYPDWLASNSDVTFVLDAFRGFAYTAAQTPPAPAWIRAGGCQ
ncbi:MAG: hypothetical protein JSU86_09760 [Phycisphaerales bacterium]|nr:MAG: hypothetical protein JSU86_09760 [Phycisphaerales bacterium]